MSEHMFVLADLSTLTTQQLEQDLAELAAELDARLQRWLALVAELEERGVPRAAGFKSTADWLAWRCGVDARTAREHARVARALATQPLAREGMATGTLSYSKVRAITRGVAAGVAERELVELAERCTAAELERTVRALRTAASADLDVANRTHARRYLDWWWEPDGSLSVHGSLTADDGAALIEAVESASAVLHPPADCRPLDAADEGASPPKRWRVPPLGARRADALVEIVQSGAPRAHLVLHADLAALACDGTADGPAGDVCALDDGPAIPSETVRRLACDAEIVADRGRRRRVVSPALRRSLELRDGGCRFPGCSGRRGTHAHHIRHWAQGGPTDRVNLVLLCRFHHRLVHEEGFIVTGADGDVRFARPDGTVIEPSPTSLAPPHPAPSAAPGARLATVDPVAAYDESVPVSIVDSTLMVA